MGIQHIESLFPSQDGFLIDDSDSITSGEITNIWIVPDDTKKESSSKVLIKAKEILVEYDQVLAVHFGEELTLPLLILVERSAGQEFSYELNILNQHTINFGERDPFLIHNYLFHSVKNQPADESADEKVFEWIEQNTKASYLLGFVMGPRSQQMIEFA